VLIGAALKMGAIVTEANEKDADILYDFGLNLGIAFQLQDDYLDTFGNPETFGKQVGGDIIENKKTYLYLKSLKLASSEDIEVLNNLYQSKLEENNEKIKKVKELFNKYKISSHIKEQIKCYSEKAFSVLEDINISEDAKNGLLQFGKALMTRNV
jgi:geranylgeranyl diphosphate synthase type II